MDNFVNVVIVDDNPADANLLKRYISKNELWEAEISIFDSAYTFFENAKHQTIDIVFVDNILGKNTGIELIQKAKKMFHSIAFVLLTGFGNENIIRQALRAGAADYLNKDELSVELIEKTIRHLLEKKAGEEKLKFTQNMLKTVIDKTKTALIVLDTKGFILEINHVFLKIIQQQNTKLVKGRHVSDWTLPEFQNIFIDEIDNCLKTGSINNLELPINTYSEIEKFALINGVLINELGNEYIYLMLRDITPRKQYEQELKYAKIKAEESDRLKSAFLANLSHEIRTPLNAITGFSSIIIDENLSTEQRKECAQNIQDGSNTLLNLINDIIEVSKIVARQIQIIKSDCYVNSILDDLFLNITKKSKQTDKEHIEISLKKSNPMTNFKILSDPFRLKQILNNLLDNALKFTEKGSIEFGYSIKKSKYIEFFVQDSGIGISEKKLSVIFEWFRKAGDTEQKFYRGSGIGLTISYSLAGLLGGELKVKSISGQGSLFWFRIPMDIDQNDLPIKKKRFKLTPNTLNFQGKTILIAEDEDTNFHFLKIALLKNNFRILRAKTGEKAIEIVKNEQVDIILMDIKMPILDGYEATKAIKEIYPNLPIIAQTAYAMHKEKEKILEVGCDDYISKPITLSSLISVISKYI
ncbi:MAG: response regulator [Bacteroidales bacterium]|nr:response regulator [Bacteroidales bacterium]